MTRAHRGKTKKKSNPRMLVGRICAYAYVCPWEFSSIPGKRENVCCRSVYINVPLGFCAQVALARDVWTEMLSRWCPLTVPCRFNIQEKSEILLLSFQRHPKVSVLLKSRSLSCSPGREALEDHRAAAHRPVSFQ